MTTKELSAIYSAHPGALASHGPVQAAIRNGINGTRNILHSWFTREGQMEYLENITPTNDCKIVEVGMYGGGNSRNWQETVRGVFSSYERSINSQRGG